MIRATETSARLVISLSGTSMARDCWTHDQRERQQRDENVEPDGWMLVPKKAVVLWEQKNDLHPPDATQLASYVDWLDVLPAGVTGAWKDGLPGACVPEHERPMFQRELGTRVLDVTWRQVRAALKEAVKGATAQRAPVLHFVHRHAQDYFEEEFVGVVADGPALAKAIVRARQRQGTPAFEFARARVKRLLDDLRAALSKWKDAPLVNGEVAWEFDKPSCDPSAAGGVVMYAWPKDAKVRANVGKTRVVLWVDLSRGDDG